MAKKDTVSTPLSQSYKIGTVGYEVIVRDNTNGDVRSIGFFLEESIAHKYALRYVGDMRDECIVIKVTITDVTKLETPALKWSN